MQRDAVQERVARELVPRIERWLGRDLEVGGLRYHLFPLWVELTDVALAGPTPGDPPVATAERLYLQAELRDLLRSKLVVQEVRAEGVRFYLERFAEGGDNLPRPHRRERRRERPFEVELQGLYLEDGAFVLADREVPLDLEARGVRLGLVEAGGGEMRVQGRVVVEETTVALPRARPISAAIAARVVLGRDGLEIEHARVGSPDAAARVEGTVVWRGDKQVTLGVAGHVSDDLFRRLGYLEEGIDGEADVEGTFRWTPGVWGWRAQIETPRLTLLDWTLTEVAAQAVGDRNGVAVDLDRGRYGGGAVTGRLEVDLAEEVRRTTVALDLQRIDVERFLGDADIPVEGVAATLGGTLDFRFAEADWRQGEGWADLAVRAAVGRPGLPVSGTVPLVVERGIVSTAAARLFASEQVVTAQAAYDLGRERGQIAFQIDSGDIGPLAALLPVAEAEEPPPLWLPTAGRGELAGTLFLGPEGPRTVVRLDLREAAAPGIAAAAVTGGIEVTSEAVEHLRLDLTRPGGAMLVAGHVPFEGDAWALSLDVAAWPLEDAAPWLPFPLPIAGPFSGGATLAGAGEAVRGEVEGAVDPVAWEGRELGRLQARLRFDEDAVVVESGRLAAPAGTVTAEGTYRLADDGLDLLVRGENLALDRPPLADFAGESLGGEADLDLRLRGTLERPDVEGSLRGRRLTLRGHSLGDAGTAELAFDWAEGRVNLEGSVLGLVDLAGGGALSPSAAELELPFRIRDLGALAGAFGPELPPVSGEARGVLRLSGPIAPPARPEIVATIERLALEVAGFPVVNVEPVVVAVDQDEVRVRSLYVQGLEEESELFVTGSIGLAEPFPLDLRLQSTLANRWLEPYVPEGLQLTGYTDVLASVGGTLARPEPNGQAEIRGARLLSTTLGQTLEDVRAVLLFYPDLLVVDSATAEAGGGSLRASGRIPLGEGTESARFQILAQDLSLRYPEGWLLRGDAELVWSGGEEGQLVRGTVTLDRAWYLREVEVGVIDLLQSFVRHRREEVGSTDEALQAIALNLLVRAPGTVRVRNNLADLRGSAELTVRGSLARPILFGRVEAQPDGRLVYADNEYQVERATLTFANPYRIEPVLDLVATTEIAEYDVTLALFGNLDRLSASFSSDPPLPDLEVLSLLVSGAPDRFRDSFTELPRSEGDTTSAAEALLVGQAASLITERVGNLFGLDAVRVEPLASAGDTVSSARVTVGKRLSSDLYVTYSYDPSSTEEQRFQVRWQATDGFLVVLTQRGSDYAVDLLWEQRF